MAGEMTSTQRAADPRYIEAGRLFDAQVALTPGWGQLRGHALPNIRYMVQLAALGKDSGYADPDGSLERTVARYVRMNEAGNGLLSQCRFIARSAAQANGSSGG